MHYLAGVSTMFSVSLDSTLSVGSVTMVMEKVTMGRRRRVWEEILGKEVVEVMYNGHSSEEEKLQSCADTYVSCKSDASWQQLAHKLYDCGEMVAVREAKGFQDKGG